MVPAFWRPAAVAFPAEPEVFSPVRLALREKRLEAAPFLIAGIVNLTPDSFSDGGRLPNPEAAVAHAMRLAAEGAHILDLGAESTRPGAAPVGAEEEQRRLLPVLQILVEKQRNGELSAALSVDTFRADTARAALQAGVQAINDVSGGVFEPEILQVVASFRAGYVLGHSLHRPEVMHLMPPVDDVVATLLEHFSRQLAALARLGLPEECICLDPCIGFGKDLADTARIFRAVPRLAMLGRPLYFGLSRKSFIGAAAGAPLEERDAPTAVAVALSAAAGVRVHRVHDVAGAGKALALVKALYHEEY